MPEAQRAKNHFQLNKGLNTESNEISFPDGYTTDELNYELLVDGSRRRRKGLQDETGGSTLTLEDVTNLVDGSGFNSFKWSDVGGNPDKNFIVQQIGSQLYFVADQETPSTDWHANKVDLEVMVVQGSETVAATLADSICSFSQGRGVLLVSNKYTDPFFVEYDAANDSFFARRIYIQHRDFYGIEDGIAVQVGPAGLPTAITDEHNYNLRNRGWSAADIITYEADSSASSDTYPNKAMIWHRGYRRVTDVGFSDLDGIQTFNPTKLVAEKFGTSSAPQGSLFLNPLDTRYSGSNTNEGDEVQITGWVFDSGNPYNGGTINVTAVGHGRVTSDYVTISGNAYTTQGKYSYNWAWATLNGYWLITRVDDDNFTFTYPARSGKINISQKSSGYATWGQLNGNVSLPKSDGVQLTKGPVASAYFAGRAWYAGIESPVYSDTVFFSKIALEPDAFGICYQEADPTNPQYNALSSSDGGHIVIPNLGKIQRMLAVRDVLLIFSDQGVWEIGGQRRGLFTAGGYSVRKVTEAESTSGRSIEKVGNQTIYTGPRGIHVIAPNKYTSVLEEVNISDSLIQSLWNAIPAAQQKRMYSAYDETRNRIYYLYDDGTAVDSHHYQFALILDLKIGAFYKFQFNEAEDVGVCGVFSVTDSDSSSSNKKLKFLVDKTTATFDICDLDQTTYLDFDGAESPLPFFTTGWDNVGDFQRRKQAPVITVFAKRTETGYTASGNGWDGDNESSNLLKAYWDWTNDSVTGKIGSQNETYRHTRAFVPSDASDVNGYPVVVTRNKVRGRGRVLQLRFDGAATKDSHILGFSTNYKVTRKV